VALVQVATCVAEAPATTIEASTTPSEIAYPACSARQREAATDGGSTRYTP
jgi:hypothetical protein